MLAALLAFHALAALTAAGAGGRLGRRVFALVAAPPALTLVWAAWVAGDVLAGRAWQESYAWVPGLGVELGLRVDAFGLVMVGLVAGIGTLVCGYAAGYFSHPRPDLGRFAALLVAFAGAMLGLVTSDHLLALFVFWELTSITSYLLIGFEHTQERARAAALQALLITGAGGLALLAGVILLAQAAGTWSLQALLAAPPSGASATAAAVCLLAAVATKSAQVPFHSWLPGAMAAPTPVSAYLHSATMVKAGVVLATRVAPLFMVVGVVDHAAGTRDLRRLSGLWRALPGTFAVAAVAAASMAGLPPLLGFVAKEAALGGFLGAFVGAEAVLPGAAGVVALAAVVAGSALTVAYSVRVVVGGFADKPGMAPTAVERPTRAFVAPAAGLAAACAVLGVAPALLSPLLTAAGTALNPAAAPQPLALWHGVTTPLLLSAAVLAGGGLLAALAGPVERLQEQLPSPPGADAAYRAGLRGLFTVSERVTAVAQCGSLPVYLAVILTVAVALPGTALLRGHPAGAWQAARVVDSPLQAVAVAVATAAAIAVVLARRRFMAVLALGAAGYAVVALFAMHGAPDLALTQLLIESLSVVVFMLALRELPARFSVPSRPLATLGRVLLAGAVGVFVTGFAFVASAARTAPSVSRDFIANTLGAGGRNVVNVVLVDIRGFDTLGEITVLATAGLGFAALILARRARADRPGDQAPETAETSP
ncbi:MAG TPA: hydrogen gas-evolving membrane-bound hydrogenase subunit E, partial [Egibacteraceae bacterium]